MKKLFTRLTSLLLAVTTLVFSLTGCFGGGKESSESAELPYQSHYIINECKPKESNYYEEYKYTETNAKPMYMGGYPYYGGFLLRTQNLIDEENSSYATFDISRYEGKTLSFVMGSASHNGMEDNNYYALVSVRLDGVQVLEELISAHSVPKRYILDLTGKRELQFIIRRGSNDVYVAELTVWDGEPTVTGHTPDTSKNRVQLVKDLLPYLWMFASTDNAIYTQVDVRDTDERYNMAVATMSSVYADDAFKYEPAMVGGKPRYEAFTSKKSMPISGEDISTFHFNTEKQYKYLTFSAGALHEANSAPGSSWVSVYADGTRVFEEEVFSDTLPKTYTVDIRNAAMIEFEIKFSQGGVHTIAVFDGFLGRTEKDVQMENVSELDKLPDVCKLISNIPPYLVSSAFEDPLFDGSSEYLTFSMAGRKYNEGVGLYSEAGWLSGNRGAHICFNLEGKFKYLTFRAGILDKTYGILDDSLHIYLDGELSQTIELKAMNIPEKHTVELKNCQELKIQLVGRDAMVRPAYGLAEMVVYKNEVVENNLFPKPENNYPDSMPLMENIRPYMTYVSSARFAEDAVQDTHTQVVFDGSTKQEYFTVGEEKVYAGVLLRTSVHMDLLGVGGGADALDIYAAMVSIGFAGGVFLSLLAAGVIYEHAFTAFDLQGEFSKVTFTVACQEPNKALAETQTTLKIGSNQELLETIVLSSDMQPTTYTVDLKKVEQLVFFLECGEDSSPYYAIYDIVVEK